MKECQTLAELGGSIGATRDAGKTEKETALLAVRAAGSYIKDPDDLKLIMALNHAVFHTHLTPEQITERIRKYCTIGA